MSLLKKSNKKLSSRPQIAIESVQDGILKLPGNRYRMILQTSAINFDLKSDQEQTVISDMYESFLNSLNCNVQIYIRTREMDVDRYLEKYHERLANETEEIYKKQIIGYEKYVRRLTDSMKILERRFYIVVPYKAKPRASFQSVKEQLMVSSSIIDKGLSKIGMHTEPLNSLEVLNLFYSFYSPAQAKSQPLTHQTVELLAKSTI